MKRILFRTLLNTSWILLLATSCVLSPQTRDAWKTAYVMPVPANWISDGVGVSRLHDILSPDGKWLVSIIRQGTGSLVQIISTIDYTHTLKSETVNSDLGIVSWSPDSSTVLVVSSDKAQSPCSHREIFIYKLVNDESRLAQYPFNPYPSGNDTGNCVIASWDPGGEKLIVAFNNREFFIINNQGQIDQRVSPILNGTEGLDGFSWTNLGLIYIVRDINNPTEPIKYELRKVDLKNPNQYDLLFSTSGNLNVVGFDTNDPKLLLSTISSESQQDTFQLIVLNTTTKKNEKTINIKGHICIWSSSQDLPFTALQISEASQPCGGIANLWIFDWSTNQLFEYGQIVALLDWRQNDQGFAVVTGTYDKGFEIKLLKP